MADIQPNSSAKGSKSRARNTAFRLDMTPMVDLAFLLLTFFMLTTTFSKPTVMQVAMPDRKGEPSDVSEQDALTLLLDKGGRVHYFFGLAPTAALAEKLRTTTFAPDGLRQVLLRFRQNPEGVVLIKPTDQATYQSMVDALDEMNITGQRKYALVDLSRADRELLEAHRL
ncbi:ExbD/TolR family protein [Hymenobacter weizhouensis]|uniref:ExbD/TolR family protein n=1 Tax=Hymenobacter sp. YIM 151500-1 TaxID=2987689 RepID=UPI0022264337|nr:biopolymer transporter ExbD [Hymenobacter sp. YIM 151500-1]UYZ62552.1 biopolymer transporter ExbD [Hymenobacter sp. YIM 151500-1]